MTKRWMFLIMVSLFMSSISGIFIYSTNRERLRTSEVQGEFTVLPSVPVQSDTVKLNHIIFAVNQSEFETWKNSYEVIKEYRNLLALEVAITGLEYSNLIANTEITPLESILFRSALTPPPSDNLVTQVSLNAIEDADRMKVSDLWNLGYNGTGVVVAVFDNGVNFSHEGLNGQNYGAPVLFNTIGEDTEAPCKTHGTPVAGLIASKGTTSDPDVLGNAFGSKIVDMQMGCKTINGQEILFGDPLAGFDWLAGQNETIKVVNLSWGQGEYGLHPSNEFEEIITRLNRLGIVVVVSAGNVEDSRYLGDTFTVLDPGTAIGAITVGAVTDSLIPTTFTALGPNSKYLTKPDLVAPGSAVTSLDKNLGLGSFSGTSFSAPLVTGAIATLISGLNDKNIPWNAGTIKAALMRSATALPYDELLVGQGFVNLNATWEFLMNSQIDERGPMVIEVTPSTGPFEQFQTFPAETIGHVPISVISSHPELVNIDITGNISQIISHNSQLNSDYSQIVYLDLNTVGIAEGKYTGLINSSLGNDYVISEFSIFVSSSPNHKVLVDLRHTDWDINLGNYIGGYNIGTMIETGQNKGMWFYEVNTELTIELLSTYDIVWLPDPFSLRNGEYNNPDPLLKSEIEAISEFVDNGGSLFIDFLGPEIFEENVYGTNTTELNSLISQFGINASNEPLTQTYSITNVLNLTSLSTGVSTITHYGNYLITDSRAQIIGKNGNRTTVASFQNEAGGKVLVSSTNFWLDNSGISGQDPDYLGEEDNIMSNNVWNWFGNNDTITIISDKSLQNVINIDFKTQTKDPDSNPEIRISWTEVGKNESFQIPFSIVDDYFNFAIQFINKGEYEILIEYGNEYQRLFFTIQTITSEPFSSSTISTATSLPDTTTDVITVTTTGISETKESSGFINLSSSIITATLMISVIWYHYRKRND